MRGITGWEGQIYRRRKTQNFTAEDTEERHRGLTQPQTANALAGFEVGMFPLCFPSCASVVAFRFSRLHCSGFQLRHFLDRFAANFFQLGVTLGHQHVDRRHYKQRECRADDHAAD